jgi:hypothetical protein
MFFISLQIRSGRPPAMVAGERPKKCVKISGHAPYIHKKSPLPVGKNGGDF